MLAGQIKAFADLGKLYKSLQFAENTITDADVLGDVQRLLEEEIGRLDRLFDVTFNPDNDTFQGKAQQRISGVRSQIYSFKLSPDQMAYRLANADDAAQFADTDEGWNAIVDHAAASGKKLNCKPGNIQCGGKCQSGKQNCFHGMTPAQKKAAQATVNKAKSSASTSTATPVAKTAKTDPADKASNTKTSNIKTGDDSNQKPAILRGTGRTPKRFSEDIKLGDGSDTFVSIQGEPFTMKELSRSPGHPIRGKLRTANVSAVGLEFSVNGAYDAGSISDPKRGVRAAITALRGIDRRIQNFPDGQLVLNVPHQADGLGAKRARLYERAGFSEVDSDGYQWAIVRGGKLTPLSRQELEQMVL